MKRCHKCRGVRLQATELEHEVEVAGCRFKAMMPATRCAECGETVVSGADLEAFELAVAADLAQRGPTSGEAFRFMRKALGLKAVEVAGLLDVTQETVSRWENDKFKPERRALALLGSMVLDRQDGRATTMDRLRELQNPSYQQTRLLELRASPSRG
jgi:putative zinc finger/helix-turn-helix YgiT family protein